MPAGRHARLRAGKTGRRRARSSWYSSSLYDDPYDLGERGPLSSTHRRWRASHRDAQRRYLPLPARRLFTLIECGTQVSAGWAEKTRSSVSMTPRSPRLRPLVLGADRPGCVLAVGLEYRPGRTNPRVSRGGRGGRVLSRASVLAPHHGRCVLTVARPLNWWEYLSAEAGDRLAGGRSGLETCLYGLAHSLGHRVPSHGHAGARDSLRGTASRSRYGTALLAVGRSRRLASLAVGPWHGSSAAKCLTSLTSPRAALGLTGRLLGVLSYGGTSASRHVSCARRLALPRMRPHPSIRRISLRRPAATPRQAGSRV